MGRLVRHPSNKISVALMSRGTLRYTECFQKLVIISYWCPNNNFETFVVTEIFKGNAPNDITWGFSMFYPEFL